MATVYDLITTCIDVGSESFLNVLRQVAKLPLRSCGEFESIGSRGS